jgi:hypothetical protein
MPIQRAKKIDRKYNDRVLECIKAIGVPRFMARAGIKSRAQIYDVARYVVGPSDRMVNALGDHGYSRDWLMAGIGPKMFSAKTSNPKQAKLIATAIGNELVRLRKTMEMQIEQINQVVGKIDELNQGIRKQ